MNSVSTYNARSTKSVALSVDPNVFDNNGHFTYKQDPLVQNAAQHQQVKKDNATGSPQCIR